MIESKIYMPNTKKADEYIIFDYNSNNEISITFSKGYDPFWENLVNGFHEKFMKDKSINIDVSKYKRHREDINPSFTIVDDPILHHKFCCDDEYITITDEGTIFSMSKVFTFNRLALILYDIEQYDRMIFDEI